MECPLLVWMLSLNRDTNKAVSNILFFFGRGLSIALDVSCFKEYDLCYNLVKECAPHTNLPYAPTNVDSFRECCTQTLMAASSKVGRSILKGRS